MQLAKMYHTKKLLIIRPAECERQTRYVWNRIIANGTKDE